MKNLLLCLSIGLCATIPLFAQVEGTTESPKAKGRVAQFVYTSIPAGLENPVTVISGNEISQLILSKLSPSDPVKIPADGILRIVRKIENPKEPDKPTYLTLAQATVPETMTDAIIILMPVAKNSNGLIFQTKVQDLVSFKGGDTMFINMTKLKIGIELGKEKILVEPGQSNINNPLGTSKSASLPIRLSYYNPESKEWDMITASTVALYSTRREMCIFNWDSRYNRIDFESISFPVAEQTP